MSFEERVDLLVPGGGGWGVLVSLRFFISVSGDVCRIFSSKQERTPNCRQRVDSVFLLSTYVMCFPDGESGGVVIRGRACTMTLGGVGLLGGGGNSGSGGGCGGKSSTSICCSSETPAFVFRVAHGLRGVEISSIVCRFPTVSVECLSIFADFRRG